MQHTEHSLRRLIAKLSFLLLFALVCALLSALFSPEFEKQGAWFQRSGALVVVISIWVQFKLQADFTYFDSDSYAVPITLSDQTMRLYTISSRLNIIFAIAGTIIWGYGDLFL